VGKGRFFQHISPVAGHQAAYQQGKEKHRSRRFSHIAVLNDEQIVLLLPVFQ